MLQRAHEQDAGVHAGDFNTNRSYALEGEIVGVWPDVVRSNTHILFPTA